MYSLILLAERYGLRESTAMSKIRLDALYAKSEKKYLKYVQEYERRAKKVAKAHADKKQRALAIALAVAAIHEGSTRYFLMLEVLNNKKPWKDIHPEDCVILNDICNYAERFIS